MVCHGDRDRLPFLSKPLFTYSKPVCLADYRPSHSNKALQELSPRNTIFLPGASFATICTNIASGVRSPRVRVSHHGSRPV